MSSKTFYFGKTEAKTTQQTRAAQADAERAASRLEQLLALEDPTRSFDTNRNVGKETESCATAQPANDEIDSCICELQTLKNRLMQQSALLSQIVNADFELANLPHTLKKRVQEVEEQTNDTEKKLAAVSEEREMLMRQLLIVRQQLQDDESSSGSEDIPKTPHRRTDFIENGPPTRTSYVTASTISDSWDFSPSSRQSTPSLSATHFQTAAWDDSLDDDDDDGEGNNSIRNKTHAAKTLEHQIPTK